VTAAKPGHDQTTASYFRVVAQVNVWVVSVGCFNRQNTAKFADAAPDVPSWTRPTSIHPDGHGTVRACESPIPTATNTHSPSVAPEMSTVTDVPPAEPDTDEPTHGAAI